MWVKVCNQFNLSVLEVNQTLKKCLVSRYECVGAFIFKTTYTKNI
jgi:hypothetical protein